MAERGRPVDLEIRARAEDLIRAGDLSRNAIAKELGVSGSTISGIAADIGVMFDRSKSELAVRLRGIDIADLKSKLALAALDEAWRSVEDMHAPAVRIEFEGGHQVTEYDAEGKITRTVYEPGAFREHVTPEPTFSDKRNLATIYGIMISKAQELTKQQDAQNPVDSQSFIDGMQVALAAVGDRLAGDQGTDPEAEPTNTDREAMLAELEAQERASDDEQGDTDV